MARKIVLSLISIVILSMYQINQTIRADMPIAETVYRILWEHHSPAEGFKKIEQTLI